MKIYKKYIILYFEVTNIKIKKIKKLNKYIAKFVRKRTNILPNFANNMLLTILNEISDSIIDFLEH